ncbi:MAG TPA: hypothetical protein VN688_31780 [Gemmataceae bacterium]|nr:hypothetical protein [Gemmataceae bacterium]
MQRIARLFTVVILFAGTALGGEPCVSGLKPGRRPGPYSSLVSVGPERGQAHCFICETADRPAVIVFARTLSEPLGKLARKLDKALVDHKGAELRAWVTFLSDDQTALDPKVVEWSKKQSLRNVPLAVFEDVVGPPSYLLHRDADVTVLLSVKQKVVRNFAFRAGELNNERIDEILKAVPEIAKTDKK